MENRYDRTTVTQTIGGVESIVNTEPGEIYIDIPATSPRYIHVREGDRLLEGDIRSQTKEELESPTLKTWRVESISEDTVTAIDVDTDERQEWDREWLVKHLGVGEFSVGLRDFGRVSVARSREWDEGTTGDAESETKPTVIVTVYANDGERFTRRYAADRVGDWDSLTLDHQDARVDEFDEELRERFDDAVATAIDVERRYP